MLYLYYTLLYLYYTLLYLYYTLSFFIGICIAMAWMAMESPDFTKVLSCFQLLNGKRRETTLTRRADRRLAKVEHSTKIPKLQTREYYSD